MKRNLLPLLLFIFPLFSIAQNYEIYVSDAQNFSSPPWKILKYDANGQNPQTVTTTGLAWPQDILFLEDSNLMLVSNLNTNNITKYNAATGAYLGVFASGIFGPTRMEFGPDSSIYVLQWSGSGYVKRYDHEGNFLGDFTSTTVRQAIGLTWDSNQNLYVSSYMDDNVRKFDSLGADSGLFIANGLVGPTNIWFNSNGEMIVLDYSAGAIRRFSNNGNYLGIFASGLSQCEGVALLPNGNILVGNGGNGSVREYTMSGSFVQNLIPSGSGGLVRPNAIRLRNIQSTSIQTEEAFDYKIHIQANQISLITKDAVKEMTLLDLSGRTVARSNQSKIYLSDNPSGVYVLLIQLDNGKSHAQKLFWN